MDLLKLIIKSLEWVAWFFQKIGLGGLVWAVKCRVCIGTTKGLHVALLHRIRALSAKLETSQDKEAAAELASQICTEARRVLGGFLGLGPNDLHCCLKLMAVDGSGNPDEDKVVTWARSEPVDHRPHEMGDENAHLVKNNSVWCALYGRSDSKTHWELFTCFSSNNLLADDRFCCDRKDWRKYYKSTVAFPLRYPNDSDKYVLQNLGFIAFDSPSKDVFKGMPDIFKFRDEPAKYRDALELSPVFHIGAIIADSIAVAIRPLFRVTS